MMMMIMSMYETKIIEAARKVREAQDAVGGPIGLRNLAPELVAPATALSSLVAAHHDPRVRAVYESIAALIAAVDDVPAMESGETATTAPTEDDLEAAVRRHLPTAEGYEDSDSPLRMVESAGSTIDFMGKQIRAAWDALDTTANPSPVPYPGALRSGEGLAEAIRAQLAALRGERDDLKTVVEGYRTDAHRRTDQLVDLRREHSDLYAQLLTKTREVDALTRELASQRERDKIQEDQPVHEAIHCNSSTLSEMSYALGYIKDAFDDYTSRVTGGLVTLRCEHDLLYKQLTEKTREVETAQRERDNTIADLQLAVSFARRGWEEARRWYDHANGAICAANLNARSAFKANEALEAVKSISRPEWGDDDEENDA